MYCEKGEIMERLYKASISEWEIQFENNDTYTLDVVLEEKITDHNNGTYYVNVKVGNYPVFAMITRIKTEKVMLKQIFNIVDENANIVETIEKKYEKMSLFNIVFDSKTDGVGTVTFMFWTPPKDRT